MAGRFATLFCDNYLDGKKGKDIALLECDEGYLRKLLPSVELSCLVITNIFTDQVSRFQSEEHVAELICEGMRRTAPSVCFISKKCHYLEKILEVPGWKFVFFDEGNSADAVPPLKIPGSFNIVNAMAARAVARFFGIDGEEISAGLSKTKPAFGRFLYAPSTKALNALLRYPYHKRLLISIMNSVMIHTTILHLQLPYLNMHYKNFIYEFLYAFCSSYRQQ